MNELVEKVAGPTYYWLTVKAVCDETPAAKSFVLVPERREEALFRYRPGQFLTFRIPHENGQIMRSYSLSSAACNEPHMTICVKRVDEGRGSNWLNDHVTAGTRIEATQPAGRFVLSDGDAPLLLIAGGSGITPCISLIKQALIESDRNVKLVYANKNEASVIYRETLDGLANRFADQFTYQRWHDDARGFLTAEDIGAEAVGWEAADIYICGPEPLMDMAENTLAAQLGQEKTILTERFVSPDDEAANPAPVAGFAASPCSFRLTLDGEDYEVPYRPEQTLLEAATTAGIDVPSSCTEGHCGTCMAWLRSGEVSMASTKALSKRNIERGLVLACQSRPATDAPIWLDFDF